MISFLGLSGHTWNMCHNLAFPPHEEAGRRGKGLGLSGMLYEELSQKDCALHRQTLFVTFSLT